MKKLLSLLLVLLSIPACATALSKPSGAVLQQIIQQAQAKKCANVNWQNLDLTEIVFQPGTDFTNATISNCQLFKYNAPIVVQIPPPAPAPIDPNCIPPLPPLFGPLPLTPPALPPDCSAPPAIPPIATTQTIAQPMSSFAGSNFTGAILQGSSFVDTTAQESADCTGANFTQLRNAHNTNFSGCLFGNANFQNANLQGANFASCDLSSIQNFATVTNLQGTIFDAATLTHVQFPNCAATNISAKYAHLEGIIITGTQQKILDYTQSDFTGAYLTGAQWNWVNASNSLFTTACVGTLTTNNQLTTFNNCYLNTCSFGALQAPRDNSNNPLPNAGGIVFQDCQLMNITARGISIGNLQLQNTRAEGAAFTEIKATNLSTNPWSFMGQTSLYAAHFSGDPSAFTPSDLGTTTFDVGCDITGTRFDGIGLCSVNFNGATQLAQAQQNFVQNINTANYQSLSTYLTNSGCTTLPSLGD